MTKNSEQVKHITHDTIPKFDIPKPLSEIDEIRTIEIEDVLGFENDNSTYISRNGIIVNLTVLHGALISGFLTLIDKSGSEKMKKKTQSTIIIIMKMETTNKTSSRVQDIWACCETTDQLWRRRIANAIIAWTTETEKHSRCIAYTEYGNVDEVETFTLGSKGSEKTFKKGFVVTDSGKRVEIRPGSSHEFPAEKHGRIVVTFTTDSEGVHVVSQIEGVKVADPFRDPLAAKWKRSSWKVYSKPFENTSTGKRRKLNTPPKLEADFDWGC